ncbi:MAG: imidazole glycerol phosphate synthase subunit HisH [Chloroflexota bacterium]
MIAVIDYGAGNLSSVVKALTKLGCAPVVTSERSAIERARTLVLPGVGAAGHAMAALEAIGLKSAIVEAIARGVPFLGICLGLQILLTTSEESGGQPCLDVVPGEVRRLPEGLKVPHMGWNQVHQRRQHQVFCGIPDNSDFYFVHSYYVSPHDQSTVAGDTEYGVTFCSLLVKNNLVATQFHPEKSGKQGLMLLANFLEFAGEKAQAG